MMPTTWGYVGAGAVLLGLLAALGFQRVQLADRSTELQTERAGRAEDRTLNERAARVQTENFLRQASGWRATQKENADAHRIYVDELLADAAGARAARDQLQHRTDTLTAAASRYPARDSPAEPGGPTAAQAAELLAVMQGRLDEAADGIGDFADRAGAAGQLCERDYDALSRPAP